MPKSLIHLPRSLQWQAFIQHVEPFILINPDGNFTNKLNLPVAILSGSFNPLHEGHCKLAAVATAYLSIPLIFEISIHNVDKPALTEKELLQRAAQFKNYRPIVFTRAATFKEKAQIFPGCTFVLGFDTAERLFLPKYHGDESALHQSLKEIFAQGCRFLVACRLQNGELKSYKDLNVAPEYQQFFEEVLESDFRVDISSTLLRTQTKKEGS